MRRIERLINLIAALLDAPQPMTADEIRARIAGYEETTPALFRRTFERDKEALRAMGIPLDVVQTDPFSDQADGYVIPKARYYLPQLDLEPEEVAALHLAAQAVLGAGEEAEAGLLKLSVDAPVGEWATPRVVWGADVAAEQPLLEPFYAAVVERTPVSFDYLASGTDEARNRSLEPYGLVHRRGHWYVVGRDLARDDVRSFKLSRITSAVTTGDGTFEVPESFDAATHLGGEAWAMGADPSVTALVRFDASIRWWAEQNMPGAPTTQAPDDAVDVAITVANLDALLSWIIGFGDRVEILAPPEARGRLIEHLAPFLEERA
jgi:proteasome accessory factor B